MSAKMLCIILIQTERFVRFSFCSLSGFFFFFFCCCFVVEFFKWVFVLVFLLLLEERDVAPW